MLIRDAQMLRRGQRRAREQVDVGEASAREELELAVERETWDLEGCGAGVGARQDRAAGRVDPAEELDLVGDCDRADLGLGWFRRLSTGRPSLRDREAGAFPHTLRDEPRAVALAGLLGCLERRHPAGGEHRGRTQRHVALDQ